MYDYMLLIYLNHINQTILNNHYILISFPIYNLIIMMMIDFLILVEVIYLVLQLNNEFKIKLPLLHMVHFHYLIMKLMYCMLKILCQL